jgi:ketosteroid isomerase-like protein
MRYLTCLLVALCISANTLAAQDPPKFSPAEQEVLSASQARMDAANGGDPKAAARYVADDCLFSTDDGSLQTKAQWLDHIGKQLVGYDRLTNSRDFVVRMHGNVAVVNFRATAHEQYGDTDLISEQRRTETWIKQNGTWLLIAMQWDNMPVNLRKPAAVDPEVYKDYVGQYKLRPHGQVEIISANDGRLWSELGGEKDEYLPLGSDTFFIKSDLGTTTFSRDAQGHVNGYTYHRDDGQEIHVKKIK